MLALSAVNFGLYGPRIFGPYVRVTAGVVGAVLFMMLVVYPALILAVVVTLAPGVNPILDMFETMNNVTGDLVCTWVVAEREGLTGTG